MFTCKPTGLAQSAIHGWGAFARRPLARGAMVVEYVGEVVRATVADVRERSHYDAVVGAGTYIFRCGLGTLRLQSVPNEAIQHTIGTQATIANQAKAERRTLLLHSKGLYSSVSR